MLAYILALAVGLGSLGIYLAAFFFPEIHRKNDFIWSGVGLFYALILWVCAGRITGGLLLGQIAGVALLGWSVTQTLQLRRQLTPYQQQTEIPSAAEVKNNVQEQVSKLSLPQKLLSQLSQRFSGSATAAKNRLQKVTDGAKRNQSKTAAPQTAKATPNVQVIDNRTPIPEPAKSTEATEAPTAEKQSPLGAPATNINQLDAAEMSGNGKEEIAAVESIAPEVELVPPPAESITAKEPQNVEITPDPVVTEASIETPQITSSPASDSPEGDVPKLVRPNPPDPELVEAAIEDAEEKHLKASPPEPAHDSDTDKSTESR